MSRYLYKKIQNISPESLNFQHSGLKLTTLGSDPIKHTEQKRYWLRPKRFGLHPTAKGAEAMGQEPPAVGCSQ